MKRKAEAINPGAWSGTLPSGLTRQLQRLVTEKRPGACIGCGYEHNCSSQGCAVLRQISRIIASAEGDGNNVD